MTLFTAKKQFQWTRNDDGMAIRFTSAKDYRKTIEGKSSPELQLALIRMRMLAEEGRAETREVDCGVFISSSDAVRLDNETRECFDLPPQWPGGIRLKTDSVPQLERFSASIGLINPGVGICWEWKLKGPVLDVLGEFYLPSPAQYVVLLAYQNWKNSGARDELSNLSMLATLRGARKSGCQIDLETYNQIEIAHANDLTIDAKEDSTGDLILRPIVHGDFPGMDPDQVEENFGQAQVENTKMMFRVGRTIVLLDEEKTAQFKALVGRGRVPQAQVPQFKENPGAWIADYVFPDIELEFSPRVTGIGYWKNAYAGAMWDESEDWFGKRPEPPPAVDSSEGQPSGGPPDREEIEEEDDNGPVVALIAANDSVLQYGGPNWSAPEMEEEDVEPDFTGLAREPLDHQKKAVRWLVRHAKRAINNREPLEAGSAIGAGALFADDMGLGKTFSTLIFLREWLELLKKPKEGQPPAVLIVAPLSLLENWKAEISKSFGDQNTVFTRVLIAQGEGELNMVRRSPGARDVAIPDKVQEYGLGFGDGTQRSIDMPGSCVLTTYQTLRDYRFSFAKAEWSAVVFDEAQNIKNPNALQTIAAKSLKGILRITLTGTPVENHLGDFWSILDTSEPGPLGSFSEFRKNWISRMARSAHEMESVGKELRQKVGDLMLRRMKEEELGKALPQKTGHNEAILIPMSEQQVSAYDAILKSLQGIALEDSSTPAAINHQLAALWQIRQVSLHPALIGNGEIPLASNEGDARAVLAKSAKLKWLLATLDSIKAKEEKVLVFCVQKKLQQGLAQLLGKVYGISIPVINGDTKASSKSNSEETRLGLIDQFSQKPGFGVCILSPIAAGAGLNIVAANHVIHLERHWNPAKEDQATDRAYRIGQKKPVYVYLPTATHPSSDLKSFDEVLHGLIEKKKGLQGALGLIPAQQVAGSEILEAVLGPANQTAEDKQLSFDEVVSLSWNLFEALIALIYEREATRVILTPGGNDHGCDVVVLGFKEPERNLLIQCKTTSLKELNSERAVREIEGSRPYFENLLGITVTERLLHTNAVRSSRRTIKAAEVCNVGIRYRSWLQEAVQNMPIMMSDLLARDRKRERI